MEWVDAILLEHKVCKPAETSCASFESHLHLAVHGLFINAFIFLIHSAVPVQLHWSLKNVCPDSPDTHCVSTLDKAAKKDKRDRAMKSICMNVSHREQRLAGKTKALQWSPEDLCLFSWGLTRSRCTARHHYKRHLWTRANIRGKCPAAIKIPI